ncbi:hypothetical protein C4577_07815 [Candidatus Parcubacteria bacterium]|nr:MAG: hypothetical protein C4577_07815 [Candidatus Parcubacteria bacterium]
MNEDELQDQNEQGYPENEQESRRSYPKQEDRQGGQGVFDRARSIRGAKRNLERSARFIRSFRKKQKEAQVAEQVAQTVAKNAATTAVRTVSTNPYIIIVVVVVVLILGLTFIIMEGGAGGGAPGEKTPGTGGATPPISASTAPTITPGAGVIYPPPSSSLASLLPNPLPQTTTQGQQAIQNALSQFNKNNLNVYQQASSITDLPWEVLAGIHYIEGGFGSNNSLVSGRQIGNVEPDIPKGACDGQVNGPGIPIPISGGCGFKSLLDSAIYAGFHLVGKIGRKPQSFQDITTALSRYNGGGNGNCGEDVPYSNSLDNCPPLFFGEDDPYALSYFDTKHDNMYLIYCGDLTKCVNQRAFVRPGALTITRSVDQALK